MNPNVEQQLSGWNKGYTVVFRPIFSIGDNMFLYYSHVDNKLFRS